MDPGVIILGAVLIVLVAVIGVLTRRAGKAEDKLEARRASRALPEPEEEEEEKAAEPESDEGEDEEPEGLGEDEEEADDEDEKPAKAPPPDKKKKKPAAELKAGLAKTRGGFIARIGRLFAGKKTIDAATLAELEEVLLTADIGVRTSQKLFDAVKKDLSRDQLTDPEAVWAHIRGQSEKILEVGAAPLDFDRAKPFVILMIGVNGVGKTTTIGKLAAKYAAMGKKVLMAAGDTFRAAATQQLEIWGTRAKAPVVRGKEGGDPSSVVFDAIKRAQAEDYDIVLADTAGRLHTKTDLMDELQKVRRVAQKAMDSAPHETFLVVDSTTGQNAIAQAQLFQQAMSLSGIILTKLDGTAKGGVILGICDELKVPVRYIGVGEKVDDLREFDPDEFVEALYEHDSAESQSS